MIRQYQHLQRQTETQIQRLETENRNLQEKLGIPLGIKPHTPYPLCLKEDHLDTEPFLVVTDFHLETEKEQVHSFHPLLLALWVFGIGRRDIFPPWSPVSV